MQFGAPVVEIEAEMQIFASETTDTLKVTCSEGNAFKLHAIEQNMTPKEKEFIEGDTSSVVDAHRGDGNAASSTSV